MPSLTNIGNEAFTSGTSLDVTVATLVSGIMLVPVISTISTQTITGVVWDPAGFNEPLTLLKRQRESVNTGFAVDWWVHLTPTPGSNKPVRITADATVGMAACAIEAQGVDTSSLAAVFRDITLTGDTADSEAGASDPVTVTVANVQASDLLVDAIIAQVSSTSDQPNVQLDSTASGGQFGVSYQAGSDGSTLSWTKDGGGTQHWVTAVIVLMEPADAGVTWLPSTTIVQGPRVSFEPAGTEPQ